MNVLEAINSRRAVKSYDAEHKMPEETFHTLMQHAILAPTAFNIQNWRFVRVRDPQQRKAIRTAAWDQPQVTDASELLVLCFDTKAWDREPGRYWRNAPQEVQDFLLPALADTTAASHRSSATRACAPAAWRAWPSCWQPGNLAMTPAR
jgi:nitroreductase